MATSKRDRQRQARQGRIEAERRASESARRRRIGIVVGVIVLGVLALIALTGLFDDDDDVTEVEAVDLTEPTPAPEAAGADREAPGSDATAGASFANDECPPEDASGPQQLVFAQPPPTCIDEAATYRATLSTTAGDIVIDLDPALDPVSVNNLVVLARHGFYDGVLFHRVIDGFVIQAGDPVGDPPGTGGPGYDFTGATPDAPADGGPVYEVGDVAMANTGDPSSNGSQFFIVTGPGGEALDPLYSPLGQVTEGLDVALEISEVQTTGPPQDRPVDDVVIESVTIEQLAA